MFERILVPLDGSELAESVLPYVEELCPKVGAQVLVLRVIPSLQQLLAIDSSGALDATASLGTDTGLAADAYDAELHSAETYLASIKERLDGKNIHTETLVREGEPASAILDVAPEVSLIAMCTHGRTGLGRLVLGSVAEKVVRHSQNVPVLLVRHEDEADTAEVAA